MPAGTHLNPIAKARALTLVMALACTFAAASSSAENIDLHASLKFCASVKSSDLRLACFDRLASGKAVIQAEKPGTPEAKVEALVAREEKAASELDVTITAASRNSSGRWVFTFDNGQVWRQTESKRIQVPRNKPFPAVLADGAFGSLNLFLDGQKRAVKVKRLR